MSAISFGQLLCASFENGIVNASALEKLLRGLVTKLNLTDVAVDSDEREEPQSDDESETLMCTTDLDEKSNGGKKKKSLRFDSLANLYVEKPSITHSVSESDCSLINYFSNNYNAQSFETLGLVKGSHLQELPALGALPPFTLTCNDEDCSRDTHQLIKFESHMRKHSDAVNLISSQNQFFLHEKICEIHEQLSAVDERIKDLFFACEENEARIDEATSSMSDFNAKIHCLKSDVKTLVRDSKQMGDKIVTLESDKADRAYVSEELLLLRKIIFDEFHSYTRISDFEDECDRFKMQFSLVADLYSKLEGKVKRALRCLKVQLDEKMEKDGLKRFKITTAQLFDDFAKEIKVIFGAALERRHTQASATTEKLSCLSCESKVSELNSLTMMDGAAYRFQFAMSKSPVPKRNKSRARHFCRREEKKSELPSAFTCHTKESLLSFPSPRKCFIISKDREIFQADALSCMKNSSYKRV